ncbi:3-deoxy-D-manno-octulosonic acid transferase [Cribrihabitans neustonicus]|uniref:3-deoxy-D-manno-octulosonic acid transferase n=1 Tax=Cribrihabitans neustonicus TaxID=1429085 RepID=UPI003B5A6DD3
MQQTTTAPSRPPALQPRPAGELLWVHATTPERYHALCDIGRRLQNLRPDLIILASWEPGMRLDPAEGCDIAAGPLGEDTPGAARAFLAHWKPDACLWTGGPQRRVLLRQMRDRGFRLVLADLLEEELPARASRWLPDQRRRLLEAADCILTPSEPLRAQLLKAGIPPERVERSAKLRVSATPPGCSADDLAAMQRTLGSRPVWLAAHVPPAELREILDAHRGALRLLHRLLLVISLEDYGDLPAARDVLRASGLQWSDWETGSEPDEFTQVLLTGGEDLGLWYRLAPVTLVANSMRPGAAGLAPLDAASLGSALLHGPGVSAHKEIYARLGAAGAAKMVRGAAALGEAVVQLSAPDKAAEMALAGWQAVTESAATTDLLLEKVQSLLDAQEESHAGA